MVVLGETMIACGGPSLIVPSRQEKEDRQREWIEKAKTLLTAAYKRDRLWFPNAEEFLKGPQ